MTRHLSSAFEALSRSAITNADVLEWFQVHQECLPGIPPLFAGHLSLRYDWNFTFTGEDSGTSFAQRFMLSYRYSPPASTAFSCAELNAAVGAHAHVIPGAMPNIPGFSGTVTLLLDPVEWPHVAALAAFQVLNDEDAMAPYKRDFHRHVWPKVFPHIQWSTVSSLHQNGLAPDDVESFSQWLLDIIRLDVAEPVALPVDNFRVSP